MQTVIRLKRPLEESPSDTLILNCSKKQKVENEDSATGTLSTVLKFSGTHNSQNEDINEHVASIKNGIKNGIKEIILKKYKRDVDINKKLSEDAKEHSKNDRYKVVNCLRSISKDDSDSSVTVLDIEREEDAAKSESNQNYVYDVYYTDAKILGKVDDYEISIHPTSVTFDSDDVYDDSDHESEDSNAENYYRNDYPDESDVESIDENDIIERMRSCEIDLSSSDEEYAHFGEAKEDYNQEIDEDLHPTSYEKFKAKYGQNDSDETQSVSDCSDLNEYD